MHTRGIGRTAMLLAGIVVLAGGSGAWAGTRADPFPPLEEHDVHAYIAYTPAIIRELGRSLAAPPPRCLPLDRLDAAAAAVNYPGAYADISFLVWAAYEAVVADRSGDPELRARFADVPPGDRALVRHHFDEVASLVASLQQALAELRCREARAPRTAGPLPA